jgi:predicted nicotinamide N-methyase
MGVSYRRKTVHERIGGEAFELECLAHAAEDFDEVIAELERGLDPELGDGARRDVLTALADELRPFFGTLWPSARALGNVLGLQELSGQRVLELGCGLALPSLLAARRGGEVTATDRHPEVPAFLESNLRRNGLEARVRFVANDWLDKGESGLLEDGPYDWVVGSDVLYETHRPGVLAGAISRFMRPGGTVVISDPGRRNVRDFVDEMAELGFACETRLDRVADSSDDPVSPTGLIDILVMIFRPPS